MTNTAKMTYRLARSKKSRYTFTVRQRLEDAQWEWELCSGNRLPVATCPKPFSSKSICFANIEKIKHAIADGRVEIREVAV